MIKKDEDGVIISGLHSVINTYDMKGFMILGFYTREWARKQVLVCCVIEEEEKRKEKKLFYDDNGRWKVDEVPLSSFRRALQKDVSHYLRIEYDSFIINILSYLNYLTYDMLQLLDFDQLHKLKGFKTEDKKKKKDDDDQKQHYVFVSRRNFEMIDNIPLSKAFSKYPNWQYKYMQLAKLLTDQKQQQRRHLGCREKIQSNENKKNIGDMLRVKRAPKRPFQQGERMELKRRRVKND